MNRLRISCIAVLVLAAAALLAVPTASVAAPRSRERVHPGVSIVSFTARGSNGWRIDISALTKFHGKPGRSIGLNAQGPHHESVFYGGPKAKVTADGDIAAKLPGLARIAVEFDQTSEKPLHFTPEKGCTIEEETVLRKGFVRGLIKFQGERGYTTIDQRSAQAKIVETPTETCHKPRFKPAPGHIHGEDEAAEKIKYFLAGRKVDGGELTFTALSAGAPFPGTQFSATYLRKRHGLFVLASTAVDAEKGPAFSLTAPNGTPTEAQLKPPAPFSGSGSFKLESPTEASWTGDLSVEIPTLGTVDLTEPAFWAGACALHCTKTFPEGFAVGFGTDSRLP